MRFDVVTLFEPMFAAVTEQGITARAKKRGLWTLNTWNPREETDDNHRTIDDRPFGGGPGMVMMAEPLAKTVNRIRRSGNQGRVISFAPNGTRLTDQTVRRWVADNQDMILICGRYEGIDQRIIDEYDIMELSIGDYILSGGEIAAQVFIDSVVRVMDNVLGGGAEATRNESFEIGGLEWPLYTRPSAWRGRKVPEVLLSGHHGNIERWRKQQSDEITKQRRPDLIKENEK